MRWPCVLHLPLLPLDAGTGGMMSDGISETIEILQACVMKALQIKQPNVKTLCSLSDPEPGEGWARVRVKAAAICRTDFELLSGSISSHYPVTPGHEWSGVVDKVGSSADERWVGRRVTANNEVTCLACHYCRRGQWRSCSRFQQIGFDLPGAYAEYLLVPTYNLCELSDAVSFQQGALLEPLGVGLAVAEMAGVHLGTTAVILGVGPIGLNCLAAFKGAGACRILCLDLQENRLALAKSWGAQATANNSEELRILSEKFYGHGADVVVNATGSAELLEFALSLVRFGGTCVLAGYGGERSVPFRPDSVHLKNIRLVGAGNNSGYTETATTAANDGLIRTEEMITHRFSLSDAEEAFSMESISRPGYIKGVIVFPD